MGRHGLEASTTTGRGRPEDGPGHNDDGDGARQQGWEDNHHWLDTVAVKWRLLLAAACEVMSLAP